MQSQQAAISNINFCGEIDPDPDSDDPDYPNEKEKKKQKAKQKTAETGADETSSCN